MGAHPHDTPQGPAGSRLGSDLAAHVEAIVRAAEREARNAEQAIADRRRSAEEEVHRYLAAARLHVDAEAAAHAARIETLSSSTRRLADELADAVAVLRRELQRDEVDAAVPRTPWSPSATAPLAAPEPPAATDSGVPEPTWTRNVPPAPLTPTPTPAAAATEPATAEPAAEAVPVTVEASQPSGSTNGHGTDEADHVVPSAARLVAIEMAVGGSSRAEVDEHLRAQLGVTDAQELLDDVFGVASHAGSRLAWGQP